eukprot:TRINITY_DN71083_c0_g2_i1.p1 TRINITY_DN71083_c0_g2~~TRINITY_DN71083_c0_g2_i1.p1  ORF type:complete len:617 (-),score=102.37 TRINITY_DN71083_c0_g2_i1:93-1943(-)
MELRIDREANDAEETLASAAEAGALDSLLNDQEVQRTPQACAVIDKGDVLWRLRRLLPLVCASCLALTIGFLSLRHRSRLRSTFDLRSHLQLDFAFSGGTEVDVLGSSLDAFSEEFGGGDPFEFRCPVPITEDAERRRLLGEDVAPGADVDWSSVEVCCNQYRKAQFPYQFPECEHITPCPSCYKAASVEEAGGHRLAPLAALAWASAVSSNSHPKVKDDPLPQASKFVDWMEDSLEGTDTSGVKHAQLATKILTANMTIGQQQFAANICPSIGDFHEFVLNDDEDNIHSRVYKSESRKVAIVVFRGTQMSSMKNWAVDADIVQVEMQLGLNGPTALVHQGFLEALNRVLPRVKKWVNGYFVGLFGSVPKDWTLVFTGHSLGGALALLAATMAESQRWMRRPDATVTFGAPRVADDALDKWWQQQGLCNKLLRVNVYNDVIHWLPSKQISGLINIADDTMECVSDIAKCLFGRQRAKEKVHHGPTDWKHVCAESEILVPGAMQGVNNNDSATFSAFGGALSHFLENCLYGYAYGMMHSNLRQADDFCGIGPQVCPVQIGDCYQCIKDFAAQGGCRSLGNASSSQGGLFEIALKGCPSGAGCGAFAASLCQQLQSGA